MAAVHGDTQVLGVGPPPGVGHLEALIQPVGIVAAYLVAVLIVEHQLEL